ncbi:hypothetical protein [Roseivirga pacifica]|uniref:hypothetical protein n=1 Tax=Roseivirga pacifica TaxID=1267423 RepID=UPI002094479C|nr:hypothetical protein [Roseivirga pacifica]MCO6358549.1 hypothetical protein [Roseivirga pacifica]MCO6369104.1 hypothetical protein [Roseivirga pacifica]MCO6372192.1 hypothetical protein [Roseivirga pacifica]MCO6374280.1 hypothetical protein [Roseivirga pacifica]MCO6380923.1 hypothetical protein [Roseivirga pacifica]
MAANVPHGFENGVYLDTAEWEAFVKAVKQVPTEFKRHELLKVIRPACKPTVMALKRIVSKHDHTGNLEDSVGTITGKNKGFPNVLVGYRRNSRYKGYHGVFLEHGTKPRYRRGKGRLFSKKNKYTGVMPAFNLVEKAAKESEAQATQALEKAVVKYTEKAIAKAFR